MWQQEKELIGLVDVDSNGFPNIPLMKISAWHRAAGDDVEFAIVGKRYNRIYMSKVFTESKEPDIWSSPDMYAQFLPATYSLNRIRCRLLQQYLRLSPPALLIL